jgi:hypothetical protein
MVLTKFSLRALLYVPTYLVKIFRSISGINIGTYVHTSFYSALQSQSCIFVVAILRIRCIQTGLPDFFAQYTINTKIQLACAVNYGLNHTIKKFIYQDLSKYTKITNAYGHPDTYVIKILKV